VSVADGLGADESARIDLLVQLVAASAQTWMKWQTG